MVCFCFWKIDEGIRTRKEQGAALRTKTVLWTVFADEGNEQRSCEAKGHGSARKNPYSAAKQKQTITRWSVFVYFFASLYRELLFAYFHYIDLCYTVVSKRRYAVFVYFLSAYSDRYSRGT
jgi:hypothetical protein